MAETVLTAPARRWRISVTAVAVFGLGALVALAAGAVLWLGLESAAESTRRLVHERSDAALDSLERELGSRLEPITEQARWISSLVADGRLDLEDEARTDAFMFGALAATPQVAGIGFFRPDGTGRAWYRGVRVASSEDRSRDPNFHRWMMTGKRAMDTTWREPIWLDTLDKAAVLHDTPLKQDDRFIGMLGQVVLTEELSRGLVGNAPPQTTPFVLHLGLNVLAHPELVHRPPLGAGELRPLATVDEVGDPVLAALGTDATREGRWLIRSGPGIDVSWVDPRR